jgi:hypothetical protein
VEATLAAPLPWAERTDREMDFPRTYPRRYYDFAVRWLVNSVQLHKAQMTNKSLGFSTLKLKGKVWAAQAGMWLHRG